MDVGSLIRYKGKVAIVTGASCGIGSSICELLVQHGINVVGFARSEQKLKQLQEKLRGSQGNFYFHTVDVTKEEEVKKGFEYTLNNVGTSCILVNNAGVISHANLTNGEVEEWKRILDTNVLGLCICTREIIKVLKSNKTNGHIIHMNSIVGHRHVYFQNTSVYGASKWAITNLTEMLKQELFHEKNKINVKVTSISPGPVDTEIFKKCGTDFPQPVLDTKSFLLPIDVANAVLYVLSTPDHVQIHELSINPVNCI